MMSVETSLGELGLHLGLSRSARYHVENLATPEGNGDVWRVIAGGEDLVVRQMPPYRVQRHFATMQALHEAVDRDGARSLGVPEPLFASEQSGLYVERYVTAARVTDLVSTGRVPTDASRSVASLIGSSLAMLHRLSLDVGRPCGLDDHLRELATPHPAILADDLPSHRALILEALDALSDADATWGPLPIAPLHRDFHLRQLLYASDRIWVVDWDKFAWGDPSFDVGYFTTYLANHLDRLTADRWTAAFLSAYTDELGCDVLTRLPTYALFNHLRRACRRFRRRDQDWRDRMVRSLAAVEGVLTNDLGQRASALRNRGGSR